MLSHNFISGKQAGPISYSGVNYSDTCTKKSVLALSTISCTVPTFRCL